MHNLSTTDRVEDYLTFGAGFTAFTALLVSVFFALVFGLIRIQNVRAPYGPLSPFVYFSFSLISLLVAYFLLRRIGTWTFAPVLHRRRSAIAAVAVYFVISLLAVFVGYVTINPRPGAAGRLGFPDALVGMTVASVYTAILSSTSFLQDVAELLGQPKKRERRMQAWLEAHEEAIEADNFGHAHAAAYKTFVEASALLSDELENAKTNEGNRLRSEFNTWLSDFCRRDSMISRQLILTGKTHNENLAERHQTLTWVRQQIEDIEGGET